MVASDFFLLFINHKGRFATIDGYEAYYTDCVATVTGLDADRLDITDDAGVLDCLGQMQGNKRYVEIYVQTEHLKKLCGVAVCQQENESRNRLSEVAERKRNSRLPLFKSISTKTLGSDFSTKLPDIDLTRLSCTHMNAAVSRLRLFVLRRAVHTRKGCRCYSGPRRRPTGCRCCSFSVRLPRVAGNLVVGPIRLLSPGNWTQVAEELGELRLEIEVSCPSRDRRSELKGLGGRRRARTPRSQKWLALEFAGSARSRAGGDRLAGTWCPCCRKKTKLCREGWLVQLGHPCEFSVNFLLKEKMRVAANWRVP
ncbi:ribosomal silencing factor RsfS [Striga asiatica]|uniref:Ribosomal silencing factor RsfS n=1 Tax=Striga asiatica TaxID=4170 RepID=A0A5A7PC78_STRAF|nr:ribosomal silencing factor RsfS [Striga asiatica]